MAFEHDNSQLLFQFYQESSQVFLSQPALKKIDKIWRRYLLGTKYKGLIRFWNPPLSRKGERIECIQILMHQPCFNIYIMKQIEDSTLNSKEQHRTHNTCSKKVI